MKKILGIGCLVLLALGLLAGFAAWKYGPMLAEKAMNRIQQEAFKQMGLPGAGTQSGDAYLTEIEGQVYVTHEGERMEAEQGPVSEGDVIETGNDSSAAIIWPEYGRTVIDANSKITLTKAEKDGDKLNVNMKMDFGRMWTRLERLLGRDSGFEVRASNVVATVRGTSFGVERPRTGGNVKVQVAESRVAVKKMKSADSDEVAVPEVLILPKQQMDISEDIKLTMPKASVMTDAMMQADPFLMRGNIKVDADSMSWINAAMELYNSIPQDREMTQAELEALEQKAMDLYNRMPEQYKDGSWAPELESQIQVETESTLQIN